MTFYQLNMKKNPGIVCIFIRELKCTDLETGPKLLSMSVRRVRRNVLTIIQLHIWIPLAILFRYYTYSNYVFYCICCMFGCKQVLTSFIWNRICLVLMGRTERNFLQWPKCRARARKVCLEESCLWNIVIFLSSLIIIF